MDISFPLLPPPAPVPSARRARRHTLPHSALYPDAIQSAIAEHSHSHPPDTTPVNFPPGRRQPPSPRPPSTAASHDEHHPSPATRTSAESLPVSPCTAPAACS